MSCFTSDQLSKITSLVKEIEKLTDVEKLFLYLQLPCGHVENSADLDAKSKFNGFPKSSSNLFSKKLDQETTQTYTWILSHLEVDPNVSLPKQEVYDEYKAFCQANKFEPLCVADFGKAMKHAFPCVKPRRLGQRGNSRYCYSGLRKKYKIMAPTLADLIEPDSCAEADCTPTYSQVSKDCMNTECSSLNSRTNYSCIEVMKTRSDQQTNQIQFHTNEGPHYGTTGIQCDGNELVQPISSTQDQTRHRTRLTAAQNNTLTLNSTSCPSEEFIPTNQFQTNQTCTQRYNYASIIQPGTPDDDDYQHNYRDAPMTQVSKHSMNFPVITAGDNLYQNTSNQFRQEDTRSMINNVMSNITPVSTSNLITDSNLAQNHFDLDTNNSFHLNNTNNTNTFIHLTHLGSSHTDPCASPFQSPASTPYPMSSNYMNQGIQDYYSTNDSHRYNNSSRSSSS